MKLKPCESEVGGGSGEAYLVFVHVWRVVRNSLEI